MEWAEETEGRSGQIEQHDDKQHAGYTLESGGLQAGQFCRSMKHPQVRGEKTLLKMTLDPRWGRDSILSPQQEANARF